MILIRKHNRIVILQIDSKQTKSIKKQELDKKMWGKVEQCGGKCVSLNPNSFINKNACDF